MGLIPSFPENQQVKVRKLDSCPVVLKQTFFAPYGLVSQVKRHAMVLRE